MPQTTPVRRIVSSLVAPDGWSLDPLSGPLALSPDGTRVIFPVRDVEGRVVLAARALDQSAAQLLAGTDGARNPFWSADGRWIGFVTTLTGLSRIPANGGAVESIAVVGAGRGATWNREGIILYSASFLSPIFRVSAQERERVAITTIDPSRGESVHQYPEFLPDGKHFLYVVQRVDPSMRRFESRAATCRNSDRRTASCFCAPRRGRCTRRRDISSTSGTETSSPTPSTPRSWSCEGTRRSWRGTFSTTRTPRPGSSAVSQEGLLAYAEGGTIGLSQLTVFDRAGKALGNAAPTGNLWTPRISPDGRRVAAEVLDPVSNNRDIWIFDAAGREAPARITFDPGEDYTPVFSRDGKKIAYTSYRKGVWSINEKTLGSSEEERPIVTAQPAGAAGFVPASGFTLRGSKFLTDWSPDGRFIAFNGSDTKTGDDMWLLEVETQTAKLLLSTPSSERDTAFFPDGRWFAHVSTESGTARDLRRRVPRPGRQAPGLDERRPAAAVARGRPGALLPRPGRPAHGGPRPDERRFRDRNAAASLPHLRAPDQHPPIRRLPGRPAVPDQHDRRREGLDSGHPGPELGAGGALSPKPAPIHDADRAASVSLSPGARLGPYEISALR